MSAPVMELLDACAQLDIRLGVNGGKLVVNSPRGRLTPDLRQRLAESKPLILAVLRAAPPPVVHYHQRRAIGRDCVRRGNWRHDPP